MGEVLHYLWMIFLFGGIALGILAIVVVWAIIIFAAVSYSYKFYNTFREESKKLEEEERIKAEDEANEAVPKFYT